MTVQRDRSALRLTCDGCGQFKQDTKYRQHRVMWAEAQSEGWTASPIKDGKDWAHRCPECGPKPKV